MVTGWAMPKTLFLSLRFAARSGAHIGCRARVRRKVESNGSKPAGVPSNKRNGERNGERLGGVSGRHIAIVGTKDGTLCFFALPVKSSAISTKPNGSLSCFR